MSFWILPTSRAIFAEARGRDRYTGTGTRVMGDGWSPDDDDNLCFNEPHEQQEDQPLSIDESTVAR
jgi:hypothetical protein